MKKLLLLLLILPIFTFAQNVGVGTDQPTEKLTIVGTTLSSGFRTSDNGLQTQPAYNFSNQLNTGMYLNANNDLRFSVNGSPRLGVTNNSVVSYQTLRGINGTAATPTFSFSNSTNTGMYRVSNNVIGFSTSSTERIVIGSDGKLRINDLSGNGERVVLAGADGTLKTDSDVGQATISDCNVPGTYQSQIIVWYGTYGNENSWQLRTGASWNSGVIISGGGGANNTFQYNNSVTLTNGTTYYFEARDSWGDGWNGGGYFNIGSPINTGNINPTGAGIIYTFSYQPCNETKQLQRILRGSISSNGSILGGGGFAINSVGNGRYEITFSEPFVGTPSASVTQVHTSFNSNGWGGNTRDNAVITHLDANKMRVVTGDGNGNQTNRDFSFIIIGNK